MDLRFCILTLVLLGRSGGELMKQNVRLASQIRGSRVNRAKNHVKELTV